MRQKKIVSGAVVMALGLMLAGFTKTTQSCDILVRHDRILNMEG